MAAAGAASSMLCSRSPAPVFPLCSFQTLNGRHRKPHCCTRAPNTFLPHHASDPAALVMVKQWIGFWEHLKILLAVSHSPCWGLPCMKCLNSPSKSLPRTCYLLSFLNPATLACTSQAATFSTHPPAADKKMPIDLSSLSRHVLCM